MMILPQSFSPPPRERQQPATPTARKALPFLHPLPKTPSSPRPSFVKTAAEAEERLTKVSDIILIILDRRSTTPEAAPPLRSSHRRWRRALSMRS